MEPAFHGTLAPTGQYHRITGRAAEIARALGSPAGGAEHLFLGMLHDGGWLVNVISPVVDLGQAEAAVLGILGSPGYSCPAAPRWSPAHEDYVQLWGADTAIGMGDSYIGVEHAFLAIIRSRQTVPARALAGLADLDAVEAAVLEAKNAPAADWTQNAVFLPEGQTLDEPLQRAIIDALPEDTRFGFNQDGARRTGLIVIGPGGSHDPLVTREVLNTALASLGRPVLDG